MKQTLAIFLLCFLFAASASFPMTVSARGVPLGLEYAPSILFAGNQYTGYRKALTRTPLPQTPEHTLPDLAILQVRIELKHTVCLRPEDSLGVRVWIKNRGGASAGHFFVVVNHGVQYVKELAVGETKALFFPGYTNPVLVIVDPTFAVKEKNKANNTRYEMVPVPTPPLPCPTSTPTSTPTRLPLPDLIISTMRIELKHPSCLQPGDPLGVRVFVTNRGQADAGTFMVAVNGKENLVQGLAAGKTKAVFFPGYSNPVTAMVDSTKIILESNEKNNTRSEWVPVPTPPLPCPTATPTAAP